jgi:hypothetical protein
MQVGWYSQLQHYCMCHSTLRSLCCAVASHAASFSRTAQNRTEAAFTVRSSAPRQRVHFCAADLPKPSSLLCASAQRVLLPAGLHAHPRHGAGGFLLPHD